MNLDVCGGHGALELWYASRHGAGVPVFDDTTCAEPEGEFLIRYFGRFGVGSEPDEGAVVVGHGVVELHPLAFLDEGVVSLCESPACFGPFTGFGFDDGPTEATCLDEFIIGGYVFVFHVGERAVFFVEETVNVSFVVVFPFPDVERIVVCISVVEDELAILVLHSGVAKFVETVCDGDGHPAVVTGVAGRVDHLKPLLCASFGVAVDTVFLNPHGGG